MSIINEVDLIKAIQDPYKRDLALKEIYSGLKSRVRDLGSRFGVSSEDSEDVLQDAIVVLWRTISNNQYRGEASVNSFIYGVSRRMFINRTRNRPVNLDLEELEKLEQNEEYFDERLFEEKQTRIVQILETLGGKCRSLIMDFYLGFSMAELATKHGYTSTANATNQRYKCMLRLKEKVANLKLEYT